MNNNGEDKSQEISAVTKKIQRVVADNSILIRLVSQHTEMVDMEHFTKQYQIYHTTYENQKDKLIETIKKRDSELTLQCLQEMYDVVESHWQYLRKLTDNMVLQNKIK